MNLEVTRSLDVSAKGLRPRSRLLCAEGGGAAAFVLRAGDEATIIDPEGRQIGQLFVASDRPVLSNLLADAATLTFAADECVTACGADAELARAFLAARADAELLETTLLFGRESVAGASVRFKAPADMRCLLAAPGDRMRPDEQDAPTELRINIQSPHDRAAALPPPLATPRLDLRVKAATASAYRVAAGEYIQIIDVEGRQCSDFLAFDSKALADGRELAIDPTTTRTLMGSATPGPGLYAKYFDQDMGPLVEVVRDTVGRHDTFMLACNSKYYDDMGYPGHANCTDNFNAALTAFGVRPRRGWPAVNFFYNTFVSHDNSIGMDEPWSRPGDYVLLRALTDLVCASSSCADDIDPANGWAPTDIHVRVYDAASNFSKGIAHRMTPDAPPKLTRESGFHSRTSALTRGFIEYRGFWMPQCFAAAGPVAEYWACRERAALMDLSALRKFEITGPDAEALLQSAVTRNIRKLAVGQIVYTALCYEHGGMIDDGTVFRLGENNFRLVCGDDYCGVWLRQLAAEQGLRAWVKSSTDQLHNVALQGPRSRDILREVLATPPRQPSIDELKWFRFTIGKIANAPVLVSRTGYTGELGYEIWCHPDSGPKVWDAIVAAGEPYGLAPFGFAALDMVRIEAGLIFAHFEFCDQTDPFEAGIGFSVPAEKLESYVGSEALARRRAHPVRQLVGLDIAGNEHVGHGDPVHVGRAQVGIVTSATRSPKLAKTIALARLDMAYTAIGTPVEIGKLDGQQKRLKATVTRFPHYDPDKSRVRA
ncbi:Aminomethyltransferase [Methylocella tundrae]|uniref:Aminomethyltransferase n=1 Tax=Methylocella tundrae TaxID=227605 RepID=A0A8B6M7K7_METTU|nr:aminomethyltransferase family protein [Methylocella tundrae]VTZ25056.1 Aminomethyltransferase [Methylocella tundrae]VTZ50303.1 Aminomethyltransferase [Methylocella tundrae]